MADIENTIQLPPDSTGKTFRLVEVVPALTLVNQEVVTLADQDGNMFNIVEGGALASADSEVRTLLRAIILRLDILNNLIDSGYDPPDDLGGE